MSITMKHLAITALVVVLAVVATAVRAQASSEAYSEASYQAWCNKYGKSFCSSAERMKRSQAYLEGFIEYQDQVAIVERHNADPKQKWKMAVNEFFSVTSVGRNVGHESGTSRHRSREQKFNQESRSRLTSRTNTTVNVTTAAGQSFTTGVFSGATSGVCTLGTPWSYEQVTSGNGAFIPTYTSYLANSSVLVTPVQNQGHCACCAAIVAGDLLSSRAATLFGTGTCTAATNQLVACTDSTANSTGFAQYKNLGCQGGEITNYLDYVTPKFANTGLPGYVCSSTVSGNVGTWQSQYPNTPIPGPCIVQPAASYVGGTISYQYVQGETNFPGVLMKMNRLIGIYFNAINSFASYSGPSLTPYTDSSCGTDLNHALLVVGFNYYGAAYAMHYVRNSWGTGWGVSGYVWFTIGANTCSLNTNSGFILV